MKPSDCLEQTDRILNDSSMTAEERAVALAKLSDCWPGIKPPKADPNAPKPKQEQQGIEDMLTQIRGGIVNVLGTRVKEILPDSWTSDITDIVDFFRDKLNDPEPGVPTLPTHHFFDPIGLYPDVLRDAITHTPKRTGTRISVSERPTSGSGARRSPTRSFPDVAPKLVEAVHTLRDLQFEQIDAEIEELGLFEPPRIWSMPKPYDFLEEFRSKATVPAIEVPIPEHSYQRNSAQPWKGDVEVQRWRAAVEAALPPLQRVVEGSDEMTVAARGMATAWNRDAVPALQRVVDPIHNVKGGFDELIGGLMVTGQSSAELREALPADATAMGDGVYHGLEPAKVGFNELTGGMSDVIEMALQLPVVGEKLSSILYGSLRHGGTPAPRSGGTDSDGEKSSPEPDSVSYDEALDHYQQTSRQSAENIAWMRANPDEEIASGPNKGWTFRQLMKDHVEKRGGKPGFAMGGVVPGPVGAPVPAILHGGERVLRSGQAGGGSVNVCLHVHGAVLSERELVRSVREGLIRLNREVTEMGF